MVHGIICLTHLKYVAAEHCSIIWLCGMCSVSEWLRLLPFLGVLALLGYLAFCPFLTKKKQQKDSLINLKIQKENPKEVHKINTEDRCHTKAVYCRCWCSKTVSCFIEVILFICGILFP
uniref:CDGSH iron sulfur domain 2 n=1 Tax=Laticauda laticaudata TaxID=8630 RepID=A0A8C5RXK6_LATLA